MPILLISGLLILIVGTGILGSSKYDPTEKHNSSSINSKMAAKNAFMYAGLLYRYSVMQPALTQSVVNSSSLIGYASVTVHALLNYQFLIITYQNQRYLISSWDASSKSGVNVPDVIGELSILVNKRIYQGDNTFWQIPVVGLNNSCTLSQVSFIDSNKKTGTINLFTTLCGLAQSGLGVTIKKYVIFTPIINI